MLLTKPGEVVLREEIQQQLWPDDTVVGFEQSINAAVKALRDGLGDSAGEPRYVETLRRRGYRFVAEVKVRFEDPPNWSGVATTAALEVVSPTGTKTANSRLKRRLQLAALCAAVAAGIFWMGKQHQARIVPNLSFRRITDDIGLTTGAAISPDGKLVVYSSDREHPNNLDIFIQQLDGPGPPLRITNDPTDDYDPAFSPDGTQVAFRSDRGSGGIFVTPALGGEARLVAPEGRRPRFSPDGRMLMYWTGPSEPHDVRGSPVTKIWVRPVAGGEPQQVASGCRVFEETLVWSPDSKRILFIGTCGADLRLATSRTEDYGLSGWVATLDGGALRSNRDLYNHWPTIHTGPVIDQWAANPSRLLIPISDGDATSIVTIPVSTDGARIEGPAQSLSFPGEATVHLSSSGNGRTVLSVVNSQSHIWGVPIDRTGRASGEPKEVTSGPGEERRPALSRDGERLAFLSKRTNGDRLFFKDQSTGRVREASSVAYRYETPVFNREGTKVMCVQYPRPDSWRDFIFELPVSGLSRNIGYGATWSRLWDWAPDDSTLLFQDGVTSWEGL